MPSDGSYGCFGPQCTREFDTLDEMEYVAGAGDRSGRHFCESCARQLRRTLDVSRSKQWGEFDVE